jgi:uncharacterized membrane protein
MTVKFILTKTIMVGAVAAAVTGFSYTDAEAAKKEKCFGISKAGKNDCGVGSLSCAGSSPSDDHGEAFLLVPKGLCEKITGGSTSPKS